MRKHFLSLICFVVVIHLLCSCANDTDSVFEGNNIISENSDINNQNDTLNNNYIDAVDPQNRYTVDLISGAYYMTFNSENETLIVEESDITFDSFNSMIDAIRNNNFNNYQLDIIQSSFRKDDNGKIKLIDSDDIYDAFLPDGFECRSVIWSGGNDYTFSVASADADSILIHRQSKEMFESYYNTYYKNYLNGLSIESITEYTGEYGSTQIILYSSFTGKFKKIRYTLPSGTIVDETYRLKMNDPSIKTSDTLPGRITLYKTDGAVYYVINVTYPAEVLTSTVLDQFVLEKQKIVQGTVRNH